MLPNELRSMVFRGLLKRKLRSSLTILGIALALFTFCIIRSFVGAWFEGVKSSAADRLISRNAVSLVFFLPYSYQSALSEIPGIDKFAWGNWFGGIYKDEKFRFQQFAVSDSYLDLYPEYILPAEQKRAWMEDRTGLVIGADLMRNFGLTLGSKVQIKGTIFPGTWEFTVRGIFEPQTKGNDSRIMFFHWDYLNERNRVEILRQPDHVGFFVIGVKPGANPAEVAAMVDKRFSNSFAETLTESETAFRQSFVSMSSTIIDTLNLVASAVLLVMLLLLANTLQMSFREKFREISILKALGFNDLSLASLVITEAVTLSLLGYALCLVLISPLFVLPTKVILGDLANFFPVFRVSTQTLSIGLFSAVAMAVISSLPSIHSLKKLTVSQGVKKLW